MKRRKIPASFTFLQDTRRPWGLKQNVFLICGDRGPSTVQRAVRDLNLLSGTMLHMRRRQNNNMLFLFLNFLIIVWETWQRTCIALYSVKLVHVCIYFYWVLSFKFSLSFTFPCDSNSCRSKKLAWPWRHMACGCVETWLIEASTNWYFCLLHGGLSWCDIMPSILLWRKMLTSLRVCSHVSSSVSLYILMWAC